MGSGFYISTPVGHYNPDWAIEFYEGSVKHIYFVAETEGDMSSMQLRAIEDSKIHCAREHFMAISNSKVVYVVVDSYKSLMEKSDALEKRFASGENIIQKDLNGEVSLYG